MLRPVGHLLASRADFAQPALPWFQAANADTHSGGDTIVLQTIAGGVSPYFVSSTLPLQPGLHPKLASYRMRSLYMCPLLCTAVVPIPLFCSRRLGHGVTVFAKTQ